MDRSPSGGVRETRPAAVPLPWDMQGEIATIGEQQRDMLALLRQLIDLMLPKVDPDKPKLDELIASLVAQQTRTLIMLRQVGADLSEVLDRLPEGRGTLKGRRSGNGAARP